MPRRTPNAAASPAQTLEDRWTVEAQTARNLDGLSAEAAGDVDVAISLYEQNVAEGFVGDLPYGRLVALYERRQAFGDAERVLRRAIAVFTSATTRTAQDRRATVRVFRNRLAKLKERRPENTRPKRSVGPHVGRRQVVENSQ